MTTQNGTTQGAADGFIDDGYNVPRFIRGVPGLHPDVQLTVRVMLPADRSRWQFEISRASEQERPGVTARTVAERIVTWSLPRKPDPQNVGRLVPALWDKVLGIVFGESAGDPAPDGVQPENDARADVGNSPAESASH